MTAEEQIMSSGIERKLDVAGTFILIISIILTITLIVFSQNETHHQNGLSHLLIVIGAGVLIQGIIVWIIIKAGAEIIRLLKKLNKIQYDGTITGGVTQYTCYDCGYLVNIDASFCPHCGASVKEKKRK